MNDIILKETNGIVTADSRDIAVHFEKQHKDVIRAIEDISVQTSAQNCADLFLPTTYFDSYGRVQKCYSMTRDGFSLLVMGFTGQKAFEWKLAYLDAFNRMERKLSQPVTTAEQLLHQAQFLVETERRLDRNETGLKQLTGRIERIGNAILPIHDGWKDEIESRISTLCQRHGLDYRETHLRLYKALESRAHADLGRRITNKRQRLAEAGATKTAQDIVNRISVIADDADLRAHFERVVQEWIVRTEATSESMEERTAP
jgi:Rha family phage regulatory protein